MKRMIAGKIKIPTKLLALIIVSIPIILINSVYKNNMINTVVAVVYWLVGVVYSAKRIREKFALFSFNVGFFVFLLGGYTLSWLLNGNLEFFSNSYFTASYEAIQHTCYSVMLCMVTINTVYIIADTTSSCNESNVAGYTFERVYSSPKTIRQILIAILVFSYICRIAEALETLATVRRVTYYASDNYLSALPSILTYIASLYYIVLFLYWAMFPATKETMISIVSLVVLETIILMSGERGEPISVVLVIVYYIFLRNKYGLSDIRISRKVIVVIALLLPVMMYGLQMISYTRNNTTYETTLVDGVEEFLESQGGSANVVARAYDLKEKIRETGGNTFILGEIRYYIKNNVFARLITGKSLRLRNAEDALSGDNFLRTYGYVYSKTSYLKGVGSGSTYIAEAFHDGGYILLVLVNVFYAFLIAKIDRAKGRSVIATAILLNIFRYIPLLPRGMALDWLTNTFAIQNIVILGALYLLTKKQSGEPEAEKLRGKCK